MRRFRLMVVSALMSAALGVGAATLSAARPSAVATSYPEGRPNIVLITTDDQTTYDMRWMPLTRRALGRFGRTYTEAMSPHPLCCPARASLLTGQYAQNNHVQHNEFPYGGAQRLDASSTLATWLRDGGYQTAFIGKYLNDWRSGAIPPGWDRFEPMTGALYSYRDPATGGYITDALSDRTVAAVREFSAQDRPFFIWTSHIAPHAGTRSVDGEETWGPPSAAPRHAQLFADVTPPSFAKPNFNEPDIADQPSAIRRLPPQDPEELRDWFRQRIRSLQAVDEAVAAAVQSLGRAGELDDTWIVFTSDNGHAIGEHRLVQKNVLTQEVLDVPLLVRGPGVPAGSRSSLPVTLADLPVAIADLAGVQPGLVVDGVSFVIDLRGQRQPWRDTQLIQTGNSNVASSGWGFRGVQTPRYSYGRDARTGEEFLYDHQTDPYETVNLAHDPAYVDVLAELSARAEVLTQCSGSNCSRRFGAVPAPG